MLNRILAPTATGSVSAQGDKEFRVCSVSVPAVEAIIQRFDGQVTIETDLRENTP